MTQQHTVQNGSSPADKMKGLEGPLRPLDNQRDLWRNFQDPLPLDKAFDLVVEAAKEDGEVKDVIAHELRTWAFGSQDGETAMLIPVPLAGRPQTEALPLRELGFNQLCDAIDAPAQYLRKLPRVIQASAINYGLASQKKDAMFRTAGGEVRAVTSSRYAAFDNETICSVIDDVLTKAGLKSEARVRSLATGPHFAMRVTLPNEAKNVRPEVGDVIEVGLDFTNSELKLRSVGVDGSTYRCICTNGMRSWSRDARFRMRHVGDATRLREEFEHAVPTALAEARGDLDRWENSLHTQIEDVLGELSGLSSFGLTQGDINGLKLEVAREHTALPENTSANEAIKALEDMQLNAFWVANAMTRYAQDKNTGDRLTMEEAAGKYLRQRVAV